MTDYRITRRGLVKAAGATTAAFALPAFQNTNAWAADTVREGLQIGGMGALRTTLGSAATTESFKPEFADFQDSTSALLALEQGSLDVVNTTSQHLIRAINENIPVKWVCGWGGGYNVLLARKNIGLKKGDAASLKSLVASRKQSGKPLTIGVPTGSMQHAKLSIYLKSIGVDPDKDIQVANIPFPNHPRVLEAGEVDLAMTLSAFGALAINNGDAELFLHLFDGSFGKQEIGFIVTDKLIKDKPELVQRIVNAHVAAIRTFMGQPEKQIEFERKYSRLPEPVIALQEREFLRYNFRTNVADIRKMAGELHQLGWVKEDFGAKVDRFVDLSFAVKASNLSADEMSRW